MDPQDLSPAEAVDRYLAQREADATERTLRSYRSRLETFADWCESNGIDRLGELTPFAIDEFQMDRHQAETAVTTTRGRLATLQVFLKYLDGLGAIDEGVVDAVEVPQLDRHEAADRTRLDPAEADRLLAHYRDDPATFGTAHHAVVELLWWTGARLGGIQALDLDDYEPDEARIRFRHRPDTGTRLKNGREGERYIGLSQDVIDALDHYIARERYDKRDEHGRRPLFCTRQGRPSETTLRFWSYLGTQPCVYGPCPHDREPATCSYRERNHASKCPSSRAPHHLRTGSITWQLNRGLTVEQVGARVNASPDVIREFYDAADDLEQFEERRSVAVDRLADPDTTESDS